MPLGTIWRDPKVVADEQALAIRDVLQVAMQLALDVELDEVEVRVRNIGPLDINYMPVGIEIDTGTGKSGKRVTNKKEIACNIAARVFRSGVLPEHWIGSDKSYVWLRICESVFVPIGHPEDAR